MSIVTLTNSTSPDTVERPTADDDPYERQTQLNALAHNFDDHDHTAGKNLGVGRLQVAATPTGSGHVQVTGDTFRWWGASAGAIRTAVAVEGAQTITGAKTLSAPLTLPVGSAAAPALTFDSGNGIYSEGTDRLGFATSGVLRLEIRANGDVVPGLALASTSTGGFLWIAGAAGPPTGVPANYGNVVPLYYDFTNNRVYAYNAGIGAWRYRSFDNT